MPNVGSRGPILPELWLLLSVGGEEVVDSGGEGVAAPVEEVELPARGCCVSLDSKRSVFQASRVEVRLTGSGVAEVGVEVGVAVDGEGTLWGVKRPWELWLVLSGVAAAFEGEAVGNLGGG